MWPAFHTHQARSSGYASHYSCPRTTRIRSRGLSPVTVLQALVDDVSAYQDRYAFLGARGGRPVAPEGTKKAVTDAMSYLGDAWKAMDKSVQGLRVNLPRKNQGMPKPDGSEERDQFSTWAQPNWWNRAPKWLDELPWWLEGYLQRKAMEGDLKGKEETPLVEDQRDLERTSHHRAHR